MVSGKHRKHGVEGRRQWRKAHLAMDTATSDIRAVEFSQVGKATAPSCRTCWGRYPRSKTRVADRPGCALVERSGRPVDYRRHSFDGCIGGPEEIVGALGALGPRPGPSETRAGIRPKVRVRDAERLARAQGCLLGQLAGDALGSAVEFRSAAEIARSPADGITRLTDGGIWNLIAGQSTDDSEMALALARTLVSEGAFDPATVGQDYVRWARSGPFDMGGTTRAGITALSEGRAARSPIRSP
jgi:hypothetical protein